MKSSLSTGLSFNLSATALRRVLSGYGVGSNETITIKQVDWTKNR